MFWKNVILILLLNFTFCFAKDLDIYFLNVGEGDSIYFHTPKNHNILIDSGNLITGFKVVRFLKDKNVKSIDYLIITHPHPDHCGGVFAIINNFNVIYKYDNGENLKVNECNDLYKWYSKIFRNRNYKTLKKGDRLVIDNISLNVLSPEKISGNWNDDSLVIMVNYKKIRILLMADTGKRIEAKLLKNQINLHANILKVGHHGAKDATSEKFLDAVNPQYAVISINKNNIRGYPSKKVVNLIKRKGIVFLTTFDNGTIHFVTDGKELVLKQH